MAKKKTKEEEELVEDEGEWTEDLVDDSVDELEELDISKLKFTKLKYLEKGMEHVNIEAHIDFVGEIQGRGYGADPFAIGFLKDDTGEVKITFWGDDIALAKKKKRVRIIDCGVGIFRDQLQVYPNRQRGVEFL